MKTPVPEALVQSGVKEFWAQLSMVLLEKFHNGLEGN